MIDILDDEVFDFFVPNNSVCFVYEHPGEFSLICDVIQDLFESASTDFAGLNRAMKV
jgi:hypothetical protein